MRVLPAPANWATGLVALATLGACTEYNLANEGDDAKGSRDRDSGFNPDGDTSDVDHQGRDSGGAIDTDDQEVPKGKIDVVLLEDIAYSYSCYHADMPNKNAAYIDALFDSGADVAVGVATFDDYYNGVDWWTAWAGQPYTFVQQLTTDRATAKAAIAGMEEEFGGDSPSSAYEAVRQVGTGEGYDFGCDGKWDEYYDIKPFRASASDAFGGGVKGYESKGTPGTGDNPGMGWRDNSKRVVVLIIDDSIREKSYGDEIPGGCPGAASKTKAVDALKGIDAELLGINAYEFQMEDPRAGDQLLALVQGVGSKIDTDGDGKQDEWAVLDGDWQWPEANVLVAAVFDLVD
jgi:hypothetical protein